MTLVRHEVCVVGGGPAGALVSIELARLGRSVHLVQTEPAQGVRPETASGRFAMTLARMDLAAVLDRATLSPVRQERIRRDGGEIVHDPAGSSLVVDRTALDAGLIRAARGAGVTVVNGRGVPRRESDGTWSIASDGAAPIGVVDLLVDARGRRGLGPRSAVYGRGRVAAFYGRTRAPGLRPFETIVGEAANFWYWLIGLPEDEIRVISFVGAAVRRGAAPFGWVSSALSAAGLRSAAPLEVLASRDATPRRAADPAADRLLRVGDAFLTVDPLSSSGLYVAAVSAVQAARVANTILCRPEDASMALRFYMTSQADMARSFEADAATLDGSAPPPGRGAPPQMLDMLSNLVLNPEFRLGKMAVLSHDFIEARPALERRGQRALAFVEGWPIERLLTPLLAGCTLLEAMRTWPHLAVRTRLKVIELLLAEGVVAPSGGGHAAPTQLEGGWL